MESDNKNSTARRKLADRALYLSMFFAVILFGGSLFAMMLYASAHGKAETILLLIRAPFKGGFTFFVIFNSSMELLLLPATLILNWRFSERRRPLLFAAILYYCARAWTYIYFVPAIFKLIAVRAGAPVSPELAEQIMRWVNLSWIRCAIDGVLAVVLLFVATRTNADTSRN